MIHKTIIPFITLALEYIGIEETCFLDSSKEIRCFISSEKKNSNSLEIKSKELKKFFIITENELKLLDKENITIIIDSEKHEIIFMREPKIVFSKKVKKYFFKKSDKKFISINFYTKKHKLFVSFSENGKHTKTIQIEI